MSTASQPLTASLWFEFDDEAAHKFTTIIQNFAQLGKTPVFTPHITLFNTLWIDEGVAHAVIEKLGDEAQATSVTFGEIGTGELWSRSIYTRALPTEEMLRTFEHASQLLGISGPIYAPHVSLLYGELNSAKKTEIIEAAQPELPSSANITSVSLWHADPVGVTSWKRLRQVELR